MNGCLCGDTSFCRLIRHIEFELPRSCGSGDRQARVRRRERSVFRNRLLEGFYAFAVTLKAVLQDQGSGAKVQIVRFGVRLVSAAASAKLQTKAVHNTARNFVLNGENVRYFAIELA